MLDLGVIALSLLIALSVVITSARSGPTWWALLLGLLELIALPAALLSVAPEMRSAFRHQPCQVGAEVTLMAIAGCLYAVLLAVFYVAITVQAY